MTAKRAIEKQSIADKISDDLRERILSGELEEGAAIRQELLAEEYGVSRMPIREALKRLSAEGLINWENNRGGFVTKHSLDEIGEIFDLRILIEVDLFRRSIPNMTTDDFKHCQEILAQMEAAYDAGDINNWGTLNHRYHAALYVASNRSLTNEILDRINKQSDRYVRMHLSVMKQLEPAKQEHRELLALARAGDREAACELLASHIGRTKAQLLELIAARRSGEGRKA